MTVIDRFDILTINTLTRDELVRAAVALFNTLVRATVALSSMLVRATLGK